MAAKAEIYIPHRNPDLRLAFPEAVVVNAKSGAIAYFEDRLNDDVVSWKMMPDVIVSGHVNEFIKHIRRLNEEEEAKKDAITGVSFCRAVVTLETKASFKDNKKVWSALFHIARQFDGYVHVLDSLIMGDGGVIYGPLGRKE